MKKGSLIKSTGIVMGVALISRGVGFFRDILIMNSFGAKEYADAYKIATSIPETIFMLVGLAISTSFIPMLSHIKVKKGKDEMHRFANNIINILLFVSIIIFIIASFFPEEIVKALAPGFDAERIKIASDLTRITVFNLLFLSINACFTAMLQVHEDFIVPSILGLFFNLPMIIYLLLFKDFNIYGLTIANVIGNFARVVVQVPSLRKCGYKYKLFIDLKDERVKKMLILILPVVVGAGANSLNLVVDKNIASGLEVGSITTLDNAQQLITFVNTIITASISAVVYPILANRRSEGNHSEFLSVLSKAVIYLALLLIPITAGIIIYGEDLVRLIFLRGEYTESAVILASLALLGYSGGIFFTGVRDILNSTLFSMGKTKVTAFNGIIGVISNIILSVILSKSLGIAGIALASSISMMITSVLLFRSIIKLEGKLDIKALAIKIIKVSIATIIMTVIIIILSKLTKSLPVIIYLLMGVSSGGLVYFSITYLLKIEEVREIILMVKKRIRP